MVSLRDLRASLSALLFFGFPALIILASPRVWQFEPFLAGTLCLIWVVVLVVWILVLIWVYRDAEERQMSGLLWVIVCFFLGIIGLIIYLVVRNDKPAYPQGAYYQQPGYYPPPYQQQPYYQQPQYPPQQDYYQQPQQEPPKQYDPETGQYR